MPRDPVVLTASGVAGTPGTALVPAERTRTWPASSGGRSDRKAPSAIGLRQVFPVQTMRTWITICPRMETRTLGAESRVPPEDRQGFHPPAPPRLDAGFAPPLDPPGRGSKVYRPEPLRRRSDRRLRRGP